MRFKKKPIPEIKPTESAEINLVNGKTSIFYSFSYTELYKLFLANETKKANAPQTFGISCMVSARTAPAYGIRTYCSSADNDDD